VAIDILAAPALPLVGYTLHQVSARSFTAWALHAVEALNDTARVSPSVEATGYRSASAGNSILSAGFGGSTGSVPPGSLFEQAETIRTESNMKKYLQYFIFSRQLNAVYLTQV
jgi:hypothetical protein